MIDNSLRRFPQPGSALDPVVSKDGKTLYYMASIQGELWLSSMRLDVDEPEQKTLFAEPARHLGLSPDGNRFVLSKFDATSNLWSVDLDPTTALPIGPAAALTRETNLRNTVPRYSPDGDAIVYSRFALGDKGSVLTISPDGTKQTEIYSQLDNAVQQPQWTRDGRALYLQGSKGFQILDLETQRIETFAGYDEDWLQWSLAPDGKQIAFSREIDAVTNIWVEDLKGNATQITFDPLYAAFPSWSPDGQWITFELFRDGYTYLGIVPSAGGEIRRLTFEPEHSWPWGWSPDGSKIAIAASRDGVWNIWWISLEDGSTTKITDHQTGRGSYVRYPAWSPSGDQIVYEFSDSTSDIWFLDLER